MVIFVVSFPMKNGDLNHSYASHYQRVPMKNGWSLGLVYMLCDGVLLHYHCRLLRLVKDPHCTHVGENTHHFDFF